MDWFSKFLLPQYWREDEPKSNAPRQYDPRFGFKQERKEIVPLATTEEMDSANLGLDVRDACAHVRIEFLGCCQANAPLWYRCRTIRKEIDHCYAEERLRDMKEFERERRLNARERRLREKAAAN